MLVIKLAGATVEVNLRKPICAGNKAQNRGIHPGFKTQADITRFSKLDPSTVAPQKKELCYAELISKI